MNWQVYQKLHIKALRPLYYKCLVHAQCCTISAVPLGPVTYYHCWRISIILSTFFWIRLSETWSGLTYWVSHHPYILHHLQIAEMQFWDEQVNTLYTSAVPKDFVLENDEQNRWWGTTLVNNPFRITAGVKSWTTVQQQGLNLHYCCWICCSTISHNLIVNIQTSQEYSAMWYSNN